MTIPSHRLFSIFLLMLCCPFLVRAVEKLDPHTTVLPMYQLPHAVAAHFGRLEGWARVPVSDAQLILCAGGAAVAPSANFAASMRCGRVVGSQDLYFLLLVTDDLLLSPGDGWWVDPDYAELYLDFGRMQRAAKDPQWYTHDYHYPPEMGQFGFRPATMDSTPKAYVNHHVKDWKVDYACVPIEGGVAYEIRVNTQSVLDSFEDARTAAADRHRCGLRR